MRSLETSRLIEISEKARENGCMSLGMTTKKFDVSPKVSKLLLELSEKTKQLGSAIQADGSMLEELVNIDLTDELRKRMKDSEKISNQLIEDIGELRKKIRKQDKRFKDIL